MFLDTKYKRTVGWETPEGKTMSRRITEDREIGHSEMCEIIDAWTGDHFAAIVGDWLNNFSIGGKSTIESFVEQLLSEHRTIQQSTIRFFTQVLLEYGRKAKWFDDRNERSVMMCRDLLRSVEDGDLNAYLPLI